MLDNALLNMKLDRMSVNRHGAHMPMRFYIKNHIKHPGVQKRVSGCKIKGVTPYLFRALEPSVSFGQLDLIHFRDA